MFSICKQTYSPTGIENAIYCHFFSFAEKNLVTTSVNLLSVYRLYNDEGDDKKPDTPSSQPVTRKLECLATYSLFGNVMDIQSVLLPGAMRDILMLSFRDAKLSLVQYDPANHDLTTLSLHYFEDERTMCGLAENLAIPKIRVDPDCRCAVMLIYNNKLVVLPFRRDVISDDQDSVLPPISSSYIVDLGKMTEQIDNVLDIQFLYGYHEPTVFLLFEPHPTCYGRVAMRNDTCQIVAISLNIQDQANPVIWYLEGLPFDCLRVLAIPKPIGGVVVLAVNSLIYLNQSIPPYAVSLNSIADTSTSFPLRPQKDVRITLDAAQFSLITNDKIVVSLKGGELYVVTLVIDGMRSVRSFHFSKAASSVFTTAVVLCDAGYLFLASRLGNSLLIKYSEIEKKTDPAEPPAKRSKLDASSTETDVPQLDLEALEVYGTADNQGVTAIASFAFEVCDSLLNIGPCGNSTMGEPTFLSDEFASNVNPDLEIVTTSGHGKNGSLTVLQRTIRPQVVTTFDLPGCMDMWTVYGATTPHPEDNDTPGGDTEALGAKNLIEEGHSYLLLSRADSTMILHTGQEITEVGQSGFSTKPTVFAGNLGENHKYIVQVSQMGVRLLEGIQLLQHIPLDIGSAIVQCSVADPYVLLMSEDGVVMALTLKSDSVGGGARLLVNHTPLTDADRVTSVCVYRDDSGLFTTAYQEQVEPVEQKAPVERSFSLDTSIADDEDELLYGDSDASLNVSTDVVPDRKQKTAEFPKREDAVVTKASSYWCFIIRESSSVEIYSLPDFKLVYCIRNITLGLSVLSDCGVPPAVTKRPDTTHDDPVRELTVIGLGRCRSRPHALFFVGSDLFIYEVFSFNASVAEDHINIRFKKVDHNLLLRERRTTKARRKEPTSDVPPPAEVLPCRLRCFDDIGGYTGIFITGNQPYWLVMTAHGVLRCHPMVIDGPISSMTPFHNVNCSRGFLYFNGNDEMRVCTLPSHVTYDAHWPTRKVMLRRDVHYVSYHRESGMYAVVTSTPDMCNKFPHCAGEDKEIDILERDDRFVYPSLQMFKVELFSPSDWEAVPSTEIKLEEWENVTCMVYADLRYEGAASGMKGYMAVGTTVCYTEEVQCRGRVILFDIVEVVPEPGQPTRHKIKVFIDSEQRGAVTALSTVSGYLVTAVGQKIYIWQIRDETLSGMAFIDTHIYIHSLSTVKNLIVAADVLKSVLLYRYQDDLKVLSIVSRDVKRVEVFAIEYLVDNQQLSFLVTDRHRNLLVYSYSPEHHESRGGQRLLRKADFNHGSLINSMFRVKCRWSDASFDKKTASMLERRHTTYFTTLDGSVGFVLPLSEKVYRRLFMVQNFLTMQMAHVGGLNPKAYHAVKSTSSDLSNPQRNILDGELLWRFLSLAVTEQNELSKRIGTTTDQIMDDMLDIDRCTVHF